MPPCASRELRNFLKLSAPQLFAPGAAILRRGAAADLAHPRPLVFAIVERARRANLVFQENRVETWPGVSQFEMVAGIGFEPMTFRL